MEKLRQFNTSGYIWETNNISIEGGEVKEISLDNSKPNMFVLQNANPVDINISLSHIPTLYNYEFQVKANTTDTFGRPSSTTKVYLFNTGSVTANVKLFSVNDTFDMNILKNTNVNIDGATVTVEDNGVIKGFQAGVSLPSGSNTIGTVKLENGITSNINTLKVNSETNKTNINNINTKIDSVNSNLIDIYDELDISNDKIKDILAYGFGIEPKFIDTYYLNKTSSFNYTETVGGKHLHFVYLFNDNDDVVMKRNGVEIFTIYGGEQITNFDILLKANDNITIEPVDTNAGTSHSMRIKYFVK